MNFSSTVRTSAELIQRSAPMNATILFSLLATGRDTWKAGSGVGIEEQVADLIDDREPTPTESEHPFDQEIWWI